MAQEVAGYGGSSNVLSFSTDSASLHILSSFFFILDSCLPHLVKKYGQWQVNFRSSWEKICKNRRQNLLLALTKTPGKALTVCSRASEGSSPFLKQWLEPGSGLILSDRWVPWFHLWEHWGAQIGGQWFLTGTHSGKQPVSTTQWTSLITITLGSGLLL